MVTLQTYDVVLPVRPMSKARPRLAAGRKPYHDKVYTEWLRTCRAHMAEWWTEPPLEFISCLVVHFHGPARGDLDNRLGSVLDAGSGLIWTDDNVKVIPSCALRWIKAKPSEAHIYMKVIWTD